MTLATAARRPAMTTETSLQEALISSDPPTPNGAEPPSNPAHERLPAHETASVKRFPLIVTGCVIFLLANSICQTYYVRYSSEEASSGGSYLLCWFSSSCQAVIYPLHVLASWAYRRVRVLRETALPHSHGPHCVSEMIDRLGGMRRFSLFCFLVSALNYFGTYCWYVALDLLPASLNFVATKSTVVFSYLLSVPILNEDVQVFQGLVMLTIILGVLCVAVGKASHDSSNLKDDLALGLTMDLLQSLMSSMYSCVFKRFNPLPRPADVTFIMTIQGCIALVLFWPPLLWLEDSKLSIMQAKPAVAEFLIVNSLLAVTY